MGCQAPSPSCKGWQMLRAVISTTGAKGRLGQFLSDPRQAPCRGGPRRCYLVNSSDPSSCSIQALNLVLPNSSMSLLPPRFNFDARSQNKERCRKAANPTSNWWVHAPWWIHRVSKPSQLTDSSCSRCMIRPGDDTWSIGGQPGHPLLRDKGSKLLPPASDDNCQSFRGKKKPFQQLLLLYV